MFFYVDANYYSGSGDWLDLSGNAIDFIPVGSPTFTSDPTNSYFTLDGEYPAAGQDLFYHDLSASEDMDQFSFWCWVYHLTTGDYTYQTVFDKDSDEQLCYLYGQNNPEMEMWTPQVSSGYNISSGVWLNLAWVFEEDSGPGSNGIVRFYENGIRVPTPTSVFSHNDASQTATRLTLGGGYVGASENELFAGRMASAALFKDRVLSDAEMLAAFNASKTRFGYP